MWKNILFLDKIIVLREKIDVILRGLERKKDDFFCF